MPQTITLTSAVMPELMGEPALILNKFEGEEALSTLYNYKLIVKTPANKHISWQSASNVDLKSLIGAEMTIAIELDGYGLDILRGIGSGRREISGIVETASFLSRDANQAMFEITLRPWLYLATLTTDFKIFQNKSVVDIIDEVLSEYPFPYEKSLSETYPKLDYQVQYGDTDFDFIQRLMEDWGIYWFFEHKDNKHKLVLVDHVGAHHFSPSEAYREIPFVPDDPKADREFIRTFHHRETLVSGRWSTKDYDFTKSRADISAFDLKPRKTKHNEMEIYNWPGNYEETEVGEKLSRVRIEERGAQGSRAFGEGQLRGIVCGTTFNLTGFPVDKVNREYLVIASKLEMQEKEQISEGKDFSCTCSFTVQPTSKVYRHPKTIIKRRTYGPQNAVVVGPAGEDIWTDKYGRVKVRFIWDRYAKNLETDSCWLRVSQAWGGNMRGSLYLPRVGDEVIVDFVNGDPDRPLVTGSLYNNVTQSPLGLPSEKTQTWIKSQTVGGSKENYNGIRFEDKPGQEHYWEQAERNMTRVVKNDEDCTIGQHCSCDIGATYTCTIGLSETITVGAFSMKNVLAANTLNVGAADTTTVGGLHTLTVGGASVTSVGAAHALTVGGASAVSVGGAYAISVGGAALTCVGGAWSVGVGGAATLVAGGAMAIGAGGELIIAADIIKIIGKSKVVIQGGKVELNPGDDGCCQGYSSGPGSVGGLGGLGAVAPLFFAVAVPIIVPPLPLPVPPGPPGPPGPTSKPTPKPTPRPTTPPATTTPDHTAPLYAGKWEDIERDL